LRHTFVPRIRYLGFTTRGKKGPLTTTGDLYACESGTNFDTIINRQHTSRGSSRRSSRGSSSTTSPTPLVWVPRHVARLIAPLVVDYSVSRRLVVDYFASAARPSASARRATRRRLLCLGSARCRLLRLAQARRRLLRLAQARDRLLRLRRASGCLGRSRGSSRSSSRRLSLTTPCREGSSSTTSRPPHVRVPRHVARLVVD
jgi:hypothetical protein